LADAATFVTLPMVVAPAVAAIALGLLGASGVLKLVDPEPTTGAMRAAHLPSSNTVSRLLGSIEVAVAVAALVSAGISTLAAAGLYGAFTLFTAAALLTHLPLQSCGCFGREDTPPTVIHVIFNAIVTGSLVSLYFRGAEAIDWTLPVGELVLYLGFSVVGVYATYLLLTRLPQILQLTKNS
jgi:hypothetical protein